MSRPTPGVRLAGVSLSVLAAQLVLVAVASSADWPSQVATDGPRAGQPEGIDWILDGSAISAGWPAWALLIVAAVLGALASATHYLLAVLGAAVAVLAGVVLARAGMAQALAEGPLSVPKAVVWTSAVAAGGLAVTLLWAALHELVVALRLRWPRSEVETDHLLPG